MIKEKMPYAVFGFGEYIFQFYKERKNIRLDVCNWLRIVQGSYLFVDEKQLKQLALDKTCALRFYIFMYGRDFEYITENDLKNFTDCLKKYKIFETN